MQLKYSLYFIVLLVWGQSILAQQVRYMGEVRDANGKVLSSASLVAANLKTKAFQGFAITDDKGQFIIKFKPESVYTVKISYMGYLPVIDTVFTKNTDIFKKYILKVDPQQLEGVEIKYEMPVRIKGDTIVYNADSFTTGNEKKLGDVLKKMPGIEVDNDGTVKVEGTEVKKVMVEGKNFFEGDSKLASKNIPANAVKKVEILRNFNENSQMKNLEDNEESYAINIRLKEGKKNFWFGEVATGVGTDGYYLVHPKLFYYSSKKTYNVILDANNIGEVPLSFMDYFKMTGGFSGSRHKGGSSFDNSNNLLGFSLMPNGKARAVKTKFGAFNYNYTVSPVLNLEGFVLANYTLTEMLTESQKLYLTNNLEEQSITQNIQNNFSGVFKTALDYHPNSNLSLKYDILGKTIQQEQEDYYQSNLRPENYTDNQQNTFSIQQNLEIYKTLKNDDLATLNLQHKIEQNEPLLEIITPQTLFETSSLINLSPQNIYDLVQNEEFSQQDFSLLADYYWILNDVSHLDIAMGNKFVWQSLTSSMSQILDNNQPQILEDEWLKNEAEYHYTDLFLGIYYKILWGKMTIRSGLSGHYYYLKDSQTGQTNTLHNTLLLPEFKIKYSIKRGQRLNFKYQLTNTYADINKYIQGYLLKNFNSLQQGNRNLSNVLKHTFSLHFSSYSMLNFSHFFARITYNKSIDDITTKTLVLNTDIIGQPINLAHENESLSVFASYSKRYVYWKYRLNANVNANDYYSLINGEEVLSHSLLQNYTVSLNSNLSGFINFDLSYNLSLNKFNNQFRESLYITDKPSAGVEFLFFKKSTQLNIQYEYYNYRDDERSVQNNYAFLSAEIFYQKKGSRWEFSLKGTNLLQTTSIDKESLSDLYVSTSKYYVMPRFWLLKANYKL